jgi:hypothetical protein
MNKKNAATHTDMIKWTFQEPLVKEVCSHLYKYDGVNFHGRIGDLLIFPSTISNVTIVANIMPLYSLYDSWQIENHAQLKYTMMNRMPHKKYWKIRIIPQTSTYHWFESAALVVSSMNSTVVNKNTANRIVESIYKIDANSE